MKHENCGGELKKFGLKGRYRCAVCRKMVKFGNSKRFSPGYIQRQTARK